MLSRHLVSRPVQEKYLSYYLTELFLCTNNVLLFLVSAILLFKISDG